MVTIQKEIILPNDVIFILNKLQSHGEGYLVGGAIRDILLGISPKDYDFCTNIEYDELKAIFSEYKPKEIGQHFGIIQININGIDYEIAKMRKDVGCPSDRREQEIEFTSDLEEDLKRRDFTINAIAYDGELMYLLDNEVLEHIADRKLCFVGSAIDRIKEDPLRVMRYARLICTKDLCGDLLAYESKYFIKNKLIEQISYERIRDEFNKIIVSDKFVSGLVYLDNFKILQYIIPLWDSLYMSQQNPHHDKPLITHIMSVVESIQPDLILRLSALFHDMGKVETFTLKDGIGHFYGHEKVSEEIARETMTRLKYDNKTIDTVCRLVANHMNKSHRQTFKSMRKLINRVGIENMPLLFKLMEADIVGSKAPYNFETLDNMKYMYRIILENEKETPILKVTDLKINGYDLIYKGYEGKEIGDKLKEIHNHILELGNEYNNREYLISLL